MKKKLIEVYNNYSKILINWKLDPIASIVAVITYINCKDFQSAWKMYCLIIIGIHMPVVCFRAYKGVIENQQRQKQKKPYRYWQKRQYLLRKRYSKTKILNNKFVKHWK